MASRDECLERLEPPDRPDGDPATTRAGANTVPATINATCASDVSPALNAWIASRPDGSTLVFPAGLVLPARW